MLSLIGCHYLCHYDHYCNDRGHNTRCLWPGHHVNTQSCSHTHYTTQIWESLMSAYKNKCRFLLGNVLGDLVETQLTEASSNVFYVWFRPRSTYILIKKQFLYTRMSLKSKLWVITTKQHLPQAGGWWNLWFCPLLLEIWIFSPRSNFVTETEMALGRCQDSQGSGCSFS